MNRCGACKPLRILPAATAVLMILGVGCSGDKIFNDDNIEELSTQVVEYGNPGRTPIA